MTSPLQREEAVQTDHASHDYLAQNIDSEIGLAAEEINNC